MQLTVGNLKKILEEVDDDVVLADLGFGNTGFRPFDSVKRVLLLKGNEQWNNRTFLTINGMGSHFTQTFEQQDMEYLGKFWAAGSKGIE